MSSLVLQDILKYESPYLTNNGLDDLKTEGLQSFKKLGFPSIKHEEWKYTNISPILKKSFSYGTNNQTTSEQIKNLFLKSHEGTILVFVNGVFQESLSTLTPSDDQTIIKPLSKAIVENKDLVLQNIGKQVEIKSDAFSALNT